MTRIETNSHQKSHHATKRRGLRTEFPTTGLPGKVVVPPPTVTHVRSPTPEEILESLRFMFAVGLECSNPVVDGGVRVDELESTGHYVHWKKDLQLVRDLGLKYLRYGPPIHRIFKAPGQYSWDFLDPVMVEMHRLGIRPVIDLVHFGLPDWLRD